MLVVVALWIGIRQIRQSTVPQQPLSEAAYLVDINRANERDLLNLPEVGPALARKILSHREQHGAFQSIEDLGEVSGVGPQTLKLLAPYLNFSVRIATNGDNGDLPPSEDTILTAQSRERIAP